MQESFLKDERIATWERAFEREGADMVALPIGHNGPLADVMFVDISNLDDGIIINSLVPKCWVPVPLVPIADKPFSFGVKVVKDDNARDKDGALTREYTLKFTLRYLEDDVLARIQEIIRESQTTAVNPDGAPAAPTEKAKEIH